MHVWAIRRPHKTTTVHAPGVEPGFLLIEEAAYPTGASMRKHHAFVLLHPNAAHTRAAISWSLSAGGRCPACAMHVRVRVAPGVVSTSVVQDG